LILEPKRKHFWVSTYLIKRIVTVLFNDALYNGTLDWDLTIKRIVSLIFVTALALWAGDITPNKFDDQELPYLYYEDVELKYDDGEGIEHLVTYIKIRYKKGISHTVTNWQKGKELLQG